MIYERIQVFGHFPDALFATAQAAVLPLFPQHEVQGLVRVILAVELCDRSIGVGPIVAELLLRFSRLIASSYKVVPVF